MTYSAFQAANNATSTLYAGVSAGATALVLPAGAGGLFPTSYPYLITVEQLDTVVNNYRVLKREIMKVTNNAADTLTVVRSAGYCPSAYNSLTQTNTAFAFSSGDSVTLKFTDEQVDDMTAEITRLGTAKMDKAGGTYTGAVLGAKSANIASATTTDLATATGNTVHITGTTTIASFGTVVAGTIMELVFDGVLTLTYNVSSMILPTATSITTQAGDSATFVSEGSGNWKCIGYQRADGSTLGAMPTTRSIGGTGADGALSITSGTTTLTLTADYIEKNYSSMSITSTAILDITGVSGVNGGIAYIKCSGNFTMSGTAKIQMNGQGGAGGASQSGVNKTGANGSQGRSVMQQLLITNFGVGAAGSGYGGGSGGVAVPQVNKYYGFPKTMIAACGGGGASGATVNSGSPVSGAGGRGGGILIIEIGGAINFTAGTISANGAIGADASVLAGGGGGGAGGTILIYYNTLTSTAGTVQCNGGNGGAGAGSGGGTGGGGGGWVGGGGAGGQTMSANGVNGTASTWGTGGTGGSGAAGDTGGGGGGGGYYLVAQAAVYEL